VEEDDLDNEIPEGEEEEVRIKFKLFESYPRYGMLKNLMFDDDTKTFGEIEPGDGLPIGLTRRNVKYQQIATEALIRPC
jgi:hypothetical protein